MHVVRTAILTLALAATAIAPATTQTVAPNPNDAATKRADALLKQMTTAEKIGQLTQLFLFPDNIDIPGTPKDPVSYEDHVRKSEIGSFLFVTDPARINQLQHIAVDETRLHIPILFSFDVIHGFDTEFPVPIGAAASWDPAMVEQAQAAAADEASHSGIRWAFAPMVDIARDPRWGRISEGAGEDPYLGAAMARAQVYGFQGRPGQPARAQLPFLATLKHFAGYGAAEGGRDYDASHIPEADMRNLYLPPFQAGIDAGAGTIMSAYMDLNDVPATGNRWLLTDVLRRDMKFGGWVVSDAFAVADLKTHGYAKDPADAARRAFTAGVNMDMGSSTYLKNLEAQLKSGAVTAAQLDAMVRPILATKYRLGLFEHPYADATATTHADMLTKHRALARTAAARSAVLLRNEGNLLPLSKSTKNIAVIGPLGNSGADLNGPWSLTAKGEDTVTVVQGLKQKLPGSTIEFAEGVQLRKQFPGYIDNALGKPITEWTAAEVEQHRKDALAAAGRADVVVMALGESAVMDFEYSSRSSLRLPNGQQELLEEIAALGKPMVLLLFSTRPLEIGWASEHVPAILDCYFGGTEAGNAIADLLTGDAVPGGKLPVTWPRNVGQVPIFYAHNLSFKPYDMPNAMSRYWDLPTAPQYPFGYGLSYSTFTITDLKLSAKSVPAQGSLNATVTVTNTGKVAADEVVQLYLHQQYGSASRPVRELKGFQRITLKPGESQQVTLPVTAAERTYWSTATHAWATEASDFDIWVGNSSAATLHDNFTVTP